MAFVAVAIGGGAALGALGGALSGGPSLSAYGQQANGYSQDALNAYRNLVSAGPGASDITAATGATRSYAQNLNNTASTGLYNSREGNRLAEQQFAPQRQALAQAMQDQIASANRAASSAGRSSNDPILRARLGAEQMRQSASMSADQSAAAMQLGRQYTTDSLSLQGQSVNALQGLSNQAFSNQGSLFDMSNSALMSQLNLRDSDKKNGGGGWLGALTGALTGAGAGAKMASGFASPAAADGVPGGDPAAAVSGAITPAQAFGGLSGVAHNLTAPQLPQANSAYFNPSNFARGGATGGWDATPPRAGVSMLAPNSFSYK